MKKLATVNQAMATELGISPEVLADAARPGAAGGGRPRHPRAARLAAGGRSARSCWPPSRAAAARPHFARALSRRCSTSATEPSASIVRSRPCCAVEVDERPGLLLVDLQPLGDRRLVVVRTLEQAMGLAGLGTGLALGLARRRGEEVEDAAAIGAGAAAGDAARSARRSRRPSARRHPAADPARAAAHRARAPAPGCAGSRRG